MVCVLKATVYVCAVLMTMSLKVSINWWEYLS